MLPCVKQIIQLGKRNSEKKLLITPVNVVWKDESIVYVRLDKKNIELITTNLTHPISGMPVELYNE